jgi:hypothetical protein
MAATEDQSPKETTRARGSGGDVQSKGIPDPQDTDRGKEPEGGATSEASSDATAKED